MIPTGKGKFVPIDLRTPLWLRLFWAALYLSLGLAYLGYHRHLSREIENQVERLREAGVPYTIEEGTREFEAHKAGENGAVSYMESLHLFKNLESIRNRRLPGKNGDTKLPDRGAEDRAFFTALFKTNEPAFQKLDLALKKPKPFYYLEWSEGFAMLLREEGTTGRVINLLKLRALIAIENKDGSAALNDIERMIALADSLSEEPVLVSALMRASACQSALRLLELLMNNCSITEADLVRMETLFSDWNYSPQLLKSLGMERAEVMDVFDHPGVLLPSLSEETPSLAWHLIVFIMQATCDLKRDRIYFLDSMSALEEIVGETDVTRFVELQEFRDEVREHVNDSYHYRISKMFLPGEIKAVERQIVIDARLRVARTAIAIERFRRENHRDPSDTKELVPKFLRKELTSPYTAERISIKTDSQGLVVSCDDDRDPAELKEAAMKIGVTREYANPLEFRLPPIFK